MKRPGIEPQSPALPFICSVLNSARDKGTRKVVPVHAMKAQETALLIRNLGTKWKRIFKLTTRPLETPRAKEAKCPFKRCPGGFPGPAWTIYRIDAQSLGDAVPTTLPRNSWQLIH